jgi:O-antigen/teichoic acid export membrane protein
MTKAVVRQFFKNTFVSYLTAGLTMTITLVFTPYLISMLGKERYGIWQLSFSLIGYMALANLGMKQSLVRYYSKYYATDDWDGVNGIYNAAVRIYAGLASIILILTPIVVFLILPGFKIEADMFRTAQVVVITLGIAQTANLFFVPFSAIGGFHRFDISNYFRIGRAILEPLAMVVVLELGRGLQTMAWAILGLTMVYWLSINVYRARAFPKMALTLGKIDRENYRLLFGYGIVAFLIMITNFMIYHTDNLVIGWFLPMEFVAVYAVASGISTKIRGVIGLMSVPLVPTISHFEAQQDFDKIRTIYRKAMRYLYFVAGVATLTTVFFGGPFILLWVGDGFTDSIPVLLILMLGSAIAYPQLIANSILYGLSKHKIVFYVHLGEALCNLGLSVVLIHYLGIVGVAWGTTIPQLVIYSVVYPLAFQRVIGGKARQFYTNATRSLLVAAVITAPTAWVMRTVLPPDTWLVWIVDCSVVSLAGLAGLFLFVLEPEDRTRLVAKIRSTLGRQSDKG